MGKSSGVSPGRKPATPTLIERRISTPRASTASSAAPQALGQGRRPFRRRLRQQHRELLAAHAPDHVVRAHGGAEHLGDRPRHLVARAVTVRVVDPLEVVDVDQEQRQLTTATVGPRRLAFRLIEEMPAVGEFGQRIRRRENLQLAGRLQPLGEISGEGEDAPPTDRRIPGRW